LPSAIPSDVATEPAVVTLATNAAEKMAGHIREPRTRKIAIAMPVGGQTALALAWMKARTRPSFAAARCAAKATTPPTRVPSIFPSIPSPPRPTGDMQGSPDPRHEEYTGGSVRAGIDLGWEYP
jgi:hypothetical protein